MKKMILLIILLLLVLSFFTSGALSLDIKAISELIRDEMIYPREILYTLPAILPDKNFTDHKNNEYKMIVDSLVRMGFVSTRLEEDVTRILPLDNTYDVIRQNVNFRYEIKSLTLVLGISDIEVDSVRTEQNKNVVVGRKIIKMTTPLYKPIVELLVNENKRKYTSIQMRWEITKDKGKTNVVERSLD